MKKPRDWRDVTPAEFHEAVGKMLAAARGSVPQMVVSKATGITQSKMSRVEHGAPVGLYEYLRWCDATDLDPIDFLGEILDYVPGRALAVREENQRAARIKAAKVARRG